MADVILALGGPYRYNSSSTAKNDTYDNVIDGGASRIADEYHHGFFTVGNAFNPMFSVGQAEALDKYKVGVNDFVGLFEVPSQHTLIDVAAKVVPVQYNRGYQTAPNSDGVAFDVEVRIYDKKTMQQTGTVDLVTDLNGLVANTAVFKRSAVKPTEGGYLIGDDEYVVMGLKVTGTPTGDAIKLSDVTCRVELTGHVFDYECPHHI